jgi:PAS domain S-box-containing protein
MALRKEITRQIIDLLMQNPQGLSITEMVKSGTINRNTAGRYLDNLLVSGQVEMRHFGMAKIYSLSRRLPVSSVLSISSEFVTQLDSSLRIIFLNQPFLDELGVGEKEIVGKNIEFSAFVPFFDDVFPTVLSWINNGLSGTEFRSELEVPRQHMFFFCRIAPTVFNNGQKGVSVLFEDITLRKQNEARLRESEARLRSLISVAPTGIGILANRIIFEVNDRVCSMTGYETAELVGQSTRKLYPTQEEFDRAGEIHYGTTPRTGESAVETRWKRKDGYLIDVLLSSTPLSPAVLENGFMFAALDITRRKHTEEALRESETRYRSLSEASQDLIYVIDRDDRVLYINQKAADLVRKPAVEVIGQPRSILFPPEISARQYEALRYVFKAGLPARSEGSITIRHEIRWFDHALVPIPGPDGKVASVLGVSRDITRRIVAEQEQRQNEQNNRFIAEHSVDIINRQTPECICTYTSPSVTTLLGYTEQEVLGRSVLAMVHPEDLPRVLEDIAMIQSTGQENVTATFRFRHKEGHYLLFESTTRVIRDDTGQIKEFLSISRDITGRTRENSHP